MSMAIGKAFMHRILQLVPERQLPNNGLFCVTLWILQQQHMYRNILRQRLFSIETRTSPSLRRHLESQWARLFRCEILPILFRNEERCIMLYGKKKKGDNTVLLCPLFAGIKCPFFTVTGFRSPRPLQVSGPEGEPLELDDHAKVSGRAWLLPQFGELAVTIPQLSSWTNPTGV